MAKRRRLDVPKSPAAAQTAPRPASPVSAPPPIASVAGEASAIAAAQGAVADIEAARAEGRLVISIPLEAIEVDHLVRDRVANEDEDMAALKASLKAHGQRTPIEVDEVGPGRFGLISGWRRLWALKALAEETGAAAFGTVKAIIRAPKDAGAAYIAMVEENEIRVGLSYYERARIAMMAARRGAFENAEAAVDTLFAAGSKAKRSKIRSFMTIHDALGAALRFPAAMPERLGLRVAGALKDGQTRALKAALTPPATSAEDEAARLETVLKTLSRKPTPTPTKGAKSAGTSRAPVLVAVRGSGAGRVVTLKGAGLDDALVAKIKALVAAAR